MGRTKEEELKNMAIRVPKKMWVFLKRASLEQERSMNEIIVACVNKYKSRIENNLTYDDMNI